MPFSDFVANIGAELQDDRMAIPADQRAVIGKVREHLFPAVCRISATAGAPAYGLCATGERKTASGASSAGRLLVSRERIIACHAASVASAAGSATRQRWSLRSL